MKPSTALLGLAAVANAQQESNGVLKAIQIQPDLTKFFAAVQMLPDLAQVLNTASNITIFAPTDKAFEEVLKADPNSNGLILSTLGEAAAVNLLSYHVVQGQFPSAAIPKTPAYVQTLYMSDDHENLVTGGQYVGVVNNGTGVQVLSGELSVSGVVFAVCHTLPVLAVQSARRSPPWPALLTSLPTGHHQRRLSLNPHNRQSPDPTHKPHHHSPKSRSNHRARRGRTIPRPSQHSLHRARPDVLRS